MLRKTVLSLSATIVVLIASMYTAQHIWDVSKLSPVKVNEIISPRSLEELQSIIKTSKYPISFAGGKFSQGGQIAYKDGLVIDITSLNKIVSFDCNNCSITVQPGVRWRDIQKHIDPYGLSVHVMQSYNDFTVGGSLSVNVHGRDPKGSLIKTVQSFDIVLADGSIVTASRDHNPDLFRAAIGGYGLIGAIAQVTLQLTENIKIEKVSKLLTIPEYIAYFYREVNNNDQAVFHNANLYPDDFEHIIATTWYKTDKPLTNKERLRNQKSYVKEKAEEQFLRRIPLVKKIRLQIDTKKINTPEIVYRNYEMSYSVDSLEPLLRWPTTSILQEYFIPLEKLESFIEKYKAIIKKHNVNILNVSIRYVAQENETILSYAPQDSFALVCYINVPHTKKQNKERKWTQEVINAALSEHGTFYLPYHLYATTEQFKKAYPNYQEFLDIKQLYDPKNKFKNSLYDAYMKQQ